MTATLALLLGALSCLVFVLVARPAGWKREVFIYAVGLIVAALIYVGFAALGGAALSWLALEFGGLLLFSLVALLGLRSSVWFLSLGWAAHAAWDVLLHRVNSADFVPDWYPLACLGFDVFLAVYIAVRLKQGSGSAQAA